MAYRLFEPKNNIRKRHRVDLVVRENDEYDYIEINEWIKKNLKGGYYSAMPNRIEKTWRGDSQTIMPYYFVKENDAALFKLRWG